MSDNERNKYVPFYVLESALVHQTMVIKRLWAMCVLLILLLVVSNLEWLHYESQFEDIVTTDTVEQEVTADSNSTIMITGIGDVNGASEADSNKND